MKIINKTIYNGGSEIVYTDDLKIDNDHRNSSTSFKYIWHRKDGPAHIGIDFPYTSYWIHNLKFSENEYFKKIAK